ncbi:hypothetical protein [Hydrogenophaga sp. 5NK40-0174]|uniref:COG4648 family protein n=1 Tax=Hydrogenophaga sp. 5NK40-0174 TaxID=3127649 RepID=UPI00310B4579
MKVVQVLRVVLFGAMAVAWTWASYRFGASNEVSDLAVALAVVPVLAAGLIIAWGRLGASGWTGVAVLMAVGLYLAWPMMRSHVSWVYFMQHAGIYLALAAVFGRTLWGDGDALVTALARRVHSAPISERNERYTRRVTQAWTAYFAGVVVVSAGLFFLAPLTWWSAFVHLLAAPLLALMFLGEYLCRLRFLPPEERPGMMEAINAWRNHRPS